MLKMFHVKHRGAYRGVYRGGYVTPPLAVGKSAVFRMHGLLNKSWKKNLHFAKGGGMLNSNMSIKKNSGKKISKKNYCLIIYFFFICY